MDMFELFQGEQSKKAWQAVDTKFDGDLASICSLDWDLSACEDGVRTGSGTEPRHGAQRAESEARDADVAVGLSEPPPGTGPIASRPLLTAGRRGHLERRLSRAAK